MRFGIFREPAPLVAVSNESNLQALCGSTDPPPGKALVDERELAELRGQIAAISRTQAVVEFELDGRILAANDNFLRTVGYTIEEVRGRHHAMFVAPEDRQGDDHRLLWERLRRGEDLASRRYRRVGKDGRDVWLEASFHPIADASGRPFKVVKYATDVTETVKQAAAHARARTALDKVSASVMLADEKFDIVYVNASAEKLFRDWEADFRRDLPQFDASRIIGSNIDLFHRNPAHQRQLLAALRTTHVGEVRLGGRAMRVAASPVHDVAGGRVGTVVEWFDRTQEVRAEEQVASIVKNALEGDLTERVPLEGKTGFFATLARGLNELLDNTSRMVVQIKTAANAVHRGADEISRGNATLSHRSEEQSSSLEETASSMEEMTSTVKANADNASQANQLAAAARDQAEKGGLVVGKAVGAMADISESSRKIVDIIAVIDEIAFQTNLLALNAAVEAARAGEQGRGFAVVATEVRNLAGRSAAAAKQIKTLIQDSVRKVEDGSLLVTQSGQTLEQIVVAVKKVSDIVGEIAAACREQAAGIELVNKAVMQMDTMTQQNAALVEEAAAASEGMAEEARALSEQVGRYRLAVAYQDEGRGAETPSAARSSAPAIERREPYRSWRDRNARPDAPRSAVRPARRRVNAPADEDASWREF